MKTLTEYLWFETAQEREYVNITADVDRIVRSSRVAEGMVLVSAMHITAGVYVNDAEARSLARERNLIAAGRRLLAMGPRFVIVKKGEHGSLLSGPKGKFVAPAYPLQKVVDPTGAGDSFVGGLLGYLAAQKTGSIETNLRRAMIHGAVVASFCCEGFGLTHTTKAKKARLKANQPA